MPSFRLCGSFVALLVIASVSAIAQRDVNPLEFNYQYPRIGGEIGLSSVWQSGVYYAGCGRFEKGAKINPILAAAYDVPLGNGDFRFEALAGLQSRSLSSSYPSRENVPLVTEGESGERRVVHVDVDFDNEGRASFTYLFAIPSMKYYFTKGLYAGAGLSAGFLLSSKTQYTKNIVTKAVSLGDLNLVTVSYAEGESSDPYSKVFPEEDIPDVSSFALDGVMYVGVEFPVGKRIKIGPRVLYTLPLTSVLSTPESLKLNSLQFTLGLRYELFY